MITQFLFFFSIFFSIASVGAYAYGGKGFLSEYTSVFFVLSAFSLFFPLFTFLKKDTEEIHLESGQFFLLFPVAAVSGVLLCMVFYAEPFTLLIGLIWIAVCFCFVEFRIFFLFALIFLLLVVLFLITGKTSIAETLSVQVYLLLASGVLASLIQPYLRRLIDLIPGKKRSIPAFFHTYVTEMGVLADIASLILPILILALMTLHYTRFSSIFIFDVRFLMSLALLFLVTYRSKKREIRADGWLLLFGAISAGWILFFAFPFPLWVRGLGVIVFFSSTLFWWYRGEYVKKLAYRFFSL